MGKLGLRLVAVSLALYAGPALGQEDDHALIESVISTINQEPSLSQVGELPSGEHPAAADQLGPPIGPVERPSDPSPKVSRARADIVTPGMRPVPGVRPMQVYVGGEPVIISPPSEDDVDEYLDNPKAFENDDPFEKFLKTLGWEQKAPSREDIARKIMSSRIWKLTHPDQPPKSVLE